MNDLFNINPKVSTALCILIAYILIDDLDANEQNVVGNWLELIGQTIITNSASQGLIERRSQGGSININSKKVKSLYDPLDYNIEYLSKILKEVYPNQMKNVFSNIKGEIDNIETKIHDIYN